MTCSWTNELVYACNVTHATAPAGAGSIFTRFERTRRVFGCAPHRIFRPQTDQVHCMLLVREQDKLFGRTNSFYTCLFVYYERTKKERDEGYCWVTSARKEWVFASFVRYVWNCYMVDFLLVFSDDLWTVHDIPGFVDIWFITRKRIVLPRRFTMSHHRAMPGLILTYNKKRYRQTRLYPVSHK